MLTYDGSFSISVSVELRQSCLMFDFILWPPVIVDVNLPALFPTYIYLIDNESVTIHSPKKKSNRKKNIKQGVHLIVKNGRESLCDVHLVT